MPSGKRPDEDLRPTWLVVLVLLAAFIAVCTIILVAGEFLERL